MIDPGGVSWEAALQSAMSENFGLPMNKILTFAGYIENQYDRTDFQSFGLPFFFQGSAILEIDAPANNLSKKGEPYEFVHKIIVFRPVLDRHLGSIADGVRAKREDEPKPSAKGRHPQL
jgi:hypothetical protein